MRLIGLGINLMLPSRKSYGSIAEVEKEIMETLHEKTVRESEAEMLKNKLQMLEHIKTQIMLEIK